MIEQHFATPGPLTVRIHNKRGAVELRTHTEPTTDIEVWPAGDGPDGDSAEARIECRQDGEGHLVEIDLADHGALRRMVRGGAGARVTVDLPEGATVRLTTASADVRADGRYDDVEIESASGDARIDRVAGNLKVRGASGDVTVTSVGGATRIVTASGGIVCGPLGGAATIETASGDVRLATTDADLRVTTASGDITADAVAHGAQLRTASGDQRLAMCVDGHVRLETVSGDLVVGVARGTAVRVDVQTITGDLSSEIDLAGAERPGPGPVAAGATLDLAARTVTGDVRIVRAGPPPAGGAG
jgi:hypothetical protein